MNRALLIYLLGVVVIFPQDIYAQRIIAECTIEYVIQPDTSFQLNKNTGFSGTKRIFIKGNDARVDVESAGFFQSLIYDKVNQQAVVLRVLGTNKFITRLQPADWIEENRKFDSLKISYQPTTKMVLGYECKLAILLMKDGTEYSVFYTPSIAPSVREFDYIFKDIPGFVLAYEVKQPYHSVKYTATRINFSPVPASRFDIPVTGYRVLDKQ